MGLFGPRCLRQVDEVVSTALEIAQAQGMASRGDTLLIGAFGHGVGHVSHFGTRQAQ